MSPHFTLYCKYRILTIAKTSQDLVFPSPNSLIIYVTSISSVFTDREPIVEAFTTDTATSNAQSSCSSHVLESNDTSIYHRHRPYLEKQGFESLEIGVGGQLHGTQRDSVAVPIRRHYALLVFRRGPGDDRGGRRLPVSAAGQRVDELEGRAQGGRRPDGPERRKEEMTLRMLRLGVGGYGGRGTREL